MTLHPDLRAMLPEFQRSGTAALLEYALLTSRELTAFAVAVMKKAEAECDANAQVFLQQNKNGRYAGALRCAEGMNALARRWQEGA